MTNQQTSHQAKPQPDTPPVDILIGADGEPFELGDYVVVDGDGDAMVVRRFDNGDIEVDLEHDFRTIRVDPTDVSLCRWD